MMSMKSVTFKALALTLLAGTPAALADNAVTKTAEGAWQDVKTKFFEAFDKQSVTVDFKEGSAALDAAEKSDIKTLLTANRRDAKIDRVIIAAWADKDYPDADGAKLSDAERKLGDERAAAVKAELKVLGVTNVDTYTMAERPTWLAKAFNTSDAKVKGQGTTQDAEDAYVKEVGDKLRGKGGPGKAVVYVKHVGELAAH